MNIEHPSTTFLGFKIILNEMLTTAARHYQNKFRAFRTQTQNTKF